MAELQKLLESQGAFQSDFVKSLSQNFNDQVNINTTSSTTTTTTNRNSNLNNANMNNTTSTTTTTSLTNNSNIIMDNGYKTTPNTTTSITNTNINANNRNLNGASNNPTLNVNGNTNNGNVNNMNMNKQESKQFFYVDPKANRLANARDVLVQAKEPLSDRRRLLIDHVTEASTEAHMSTTLNTEANIREANERIAKQMATGAIPDMSKMPKMDPAMMMKHFLNSMVPEITKVVNFAKSLPGFSDVDVEDQVRLIRQGTFEVMVARITLLIDHVNDTMFDPSLKMKQPRAGVRKMSPLGPFIDSFFDLAKQTNPLNLTDGENGLFGAILILCPDRHGLKDASSVNSIQKFYLQSLYMLMKKNHKDAEEKFCTLISSISSIRTINDDHFRFVQTIKQKSVSEFETHFPALHKELFDVSTH